MFAGCESEGKGRLREESREETLINHITQRRTIDNRRERNTEGRGEATPVGNRSKGRSSREKGMMFGVLYLQRTDIRKM